MNVDQMQFEAAMKTVITALQAAGYAPYSQLLVYVGTGDAAYITRQGGARELVERLDMDRIKGFLRENSKI